MAIEINDARLSCIWTEMSVEFLQQRNEAGGLAFLARKADFSSQFERANRKAICFESNRQLLCRPPGITLEVNVSGDAI
jgi:hypothetical protein